MTAYRTVREDDNVHIIEGLGIPFGGPFDGRDSYATFASPRSDLGWDLFPDRTPADPAEVEPKYIRPVRFHHGFDATVPGVRLGGWSPMRQDDDGVWVQMQLDKRNAHYAKVRALLDKNGAGLSAGTIDYNMRYDSRTGEWLEWPVWELSITPTESNPYATIAARSADTIRIIEGARADMSTQDINDLPDSAFAYIEPGGTKDEGGKTTPRSKRHFPVHDAAHVRNALARAPQSPFGEKAMPKIRAAAKKFGVDADSVRAGRRNSTTDQQHLNAAHQAAHTVVTHTSAAGADCEMCKPPDDNAGPGDDSAARSSEAPTTVRIVERGPDLGAVRASLLDLAATVAEARVRELIGT